MKSTMQGKHVSFHGFQQEHIPLTMMLSVENIQISLVKDELKFNGIIIKTTSTT